MQLAPPGAVQDEQPQFGIPVAIPASLDPERILGGFGNSFPHLLILGGLGSLFFILSTLFWIDLAL